MPITHNNVILILGPENAGKSTIWNQIISEHKALVSDIAGTTRDLLEASITINDSEYIICDMPGWRFPCINEQDRAINNMIDQASQRAMLIYIVVDITQGCSALLENTVNKLHKMRKRLLLVLTHKDQVKNITEEQAEFNHLGIKNIVVIDARGKNGLRVLLEQTIALCPANNNTIPYQTPILPKIAIIGRPNVGKSTLINYLLGEDRLITSDLPGTTTDSVEIKVKYEHIEFILVDTAGCRRKQDTKSELERLANSRLPDTMIACDIVLLLIDGSENLTQQDLALLHTSFNQISKITLLVLNKCDSDHFKKNKVLITNKLRQACTLLKQEYIYNISAKRGTGIKKLMRFVLQLYDQLQINKKIPPRKVTLYLQQINKYRSCPGAKLKFAQVVKLNPCHILIHCTNIHNINVNYRRYLINAFSTKLGLKNMPVKLIFKNS